MQCCATCGRWEWPAVWRCGQCGSWHPTWREIPLRGTLFSWTKTWHRFAGTEGLDLPFASVVVAMPDAGNRRLLGLWGGTDEQLRVDAAVEALIFQRDVGNRRIPAIRWRPL